MMDNIIVSKDILEYMNSDKRFNEFMGQCITHFVHFVIPRRDQTKEICQDYPIPADIEEIGGDMVMLTRKDRANKIFIEFWRW